MSTLPLYWLGAFWKEGCVSQCTLRDWRICHSLGRKNFGVWLLSPIRGIVNSSPSSATEATQFLCAFQDLPFSNPKPATKNTWKVAKYLLSGVSTTTQYWEKSSLRRNFVQLLFNSHGIGFCLHISGTSAVALSASAV